MERAITAPFHYEPGGNSSRYYQRVAVNRTVEIVAKGGESVIYHASDGSHYEKRGGGEPQPIEVPFDIPDSWEWARLKTLGEIIGGGTPKTRDTTLWASPEDGIPWITPADMKSVRPWQ